MEKKHKHQIKVILQKVGDNAALKVISVHARAASHLKLQPFDAEDLIVWHSFASASSPSHWTSAPLHRHCSQLRPQLINFQRAICHPPQQPGQELLKDFLLPSHVMIELMTSERLPAVDPAADEGSLTSSMDIPPKQRIVMQPQNP